MFVPLMPKMYYTAKALHLIFMVAWFAGLFYMPRLFIYQTEASQKPEGEREALVDQLKVMSNRLWYIITWPAFILTTGFAIWLLVINPGYLQQPWMHVKLGFVALLIAYHLSLQWMYKKLQRDQYPMTGMQLRFYNEAATILLFAIVFTATFKNTMSGLYGILGIVGLGLLLSFGIMLYKKLRKN
ncbi:MAG TPA: CopD family protein [Cryomorphaceae bacterium]|nr:CopD family protein [Cryomorphaceae bacterium]